MPRLAVPGRHILARKPQCLLYCRQKLAACPHAIMVRREMGLKDVQGTVVGVPGGAQFAHVTERGAEIVEGLGHTGAVGAESISGLLDRQCTFVKTAGASQVPFTMKHLAEVVEGAGDLGVVGAERGLVGVEGLLEVVAGAGQVPLAVVHEAEVVEGAAYVAAYVGVGGAGSAGVFRREVGPID